MRRHEPPAPTGRRKRAVALAGVAALAATGLSACAESGKPVLNWYVNPDGVDTLTARAAQCSTADYDIEVQELPASATDQRTQLARRLAAEDSSTDLMNLDPVFVPEFANAGWLLEVQGDLADSIISSASGNGDYLSGAADTAIWEDKAYAVPLWANTQVLWYRKSLAEAAGLDMTEPVTWNQIIEAAADNNGTVGVQANRYEGYVVWINALIAGAGGQIVSDTEAGRDATVELDSEAGRKAAEVIAALADSSAAQPDLTVSNEGTSLGQMWPASGAGEFMVNWTFVYANYKGGVGQPGGPPDEDAFKDLGWARYPASVEGEPSAPPLGGIDIGVGAYTDHPEWAMQAAECISSVQAQVDLAINNGLMPSTNAAYDEVAASGDFPKDLIELFRTSVDEAGLRPKSAYYSLISGGIQSSWHAPTSVDPSSTPSDSADYITDLLEGKSLL